VHSPWRFASKRLDEETGFYYFGKRYYSPQIGRWVTPDPAGFADGPNLYSYVHNSPLTLLDPYGLSALDETKAAEKSTSDNGIDATSGDSETSAERNSSFTADASQNNNSAEDPWSWPSTEKTIYDVFDALDDAGTAAILASLVPNRASPFELGGGVLLKSATWMGRRNFSRIAHSPSAQKATCFAVRKLSEFGTWASTSGNKAWTTLRNVTIGAPVKRSMIEMMPVKYTKSNLKLGQQMHKSYKADLHDPLLHRIKEYVLPSGRRIDFLDETAHTIYELKPFNPRAVELGQKQLEMYKEELKLVPRFKDIEWKTILENY